MEKLKIIDFPTTLVLLLLCSTFLINRRTRKLKVIPLVCEYLSKYTTPSLYHIVFSKTLFLQSLKSLVFFYHCSGLILSFFFLVIDSRMADATPGQQQQQPKGWNALRKHVMDYKIDVALWATRIATLLFTIGYFIPLFW